jgi:hypothetical protein
MEENLENLDSQNQDGIVTPQDDGQEPGLPADPVETEPVDELGELPEDTEELKRLLKEKTEQQQQTYEQLKKAKGFVRDKDGKWVKKEPKEPFKPQQQDTKSDITIMELKSLLAANVHDDSDSEEVRLYARSHGVSITEALKLPEVKSMLRTRIEIRKSEEVASSNTRRGSVKSSKDYLDMARKGEEVDMDKVAEARMQERLKERGLN